MRRKTIIFALAALSLFSCTKELHFDYRSVDKVTVIEGYVTNEDISVVVTTTRDMSDTTKAVCVSDAEVWLSDSEGWNKQLLYSSSDSAYVYPPGKAGVPGVTYTLSVTREGQTFTSKSVMHKAATITKAGFYYYEILFLKQLLFCAKVQDIPDEDNFYHYRFYRNGELFSESVMTDKKNPGGELDINFMCVDEESTMSDWDMDMVEERFFREDDEITLEVYSIDEAAYNYLYSLGLSGMTSSNPIANFTGGALGYFTTRNIVRLNAVYHADEVQDYDLF